MKHFSLNTSHVVLGLAMAGLMMLYGTAAQATTIIGTETDAGGFIGDLFHGLDGPGYVVASDGEAVFSPFHATFDVSDGIDLSGNGHVWTQAADSTWTQLGTASTWVLPATTSCGSENEPTCEPVGHFLSPDAWNPGFIGTWEILDSDGITVSDLIVTDNNGPGGFAEIFFHSDPIPEPASLGLLGIALFGFAALRRRKARNHSA